MSIQNKYDEYKERQEAKKYFRSQNDQFMDQKQWIKAITVGIVTAIACGVVLGIVIHLLKISSSLFYILCGYVIASTLTHTLNIKSQQIAIVSVVMTFLCFVVGTMTLSYLPVFDMGVSLPLSYFGLLFIESIKNLVVGDLLQTIMVIIGLGIAYSISK